MKIKPVRKQKKARSFVTIQALFLFKGGPMRDRRERRMKDSRNIRREMEAE